MPGWIRGIGGAALFVVSYIDNWLSPLFWLLLGLVALDFLFSIKKIRDENFQFQKLGSAIMSFGLPSVIANDIHSPELVKSVVAGLVIIYLSIVAPKVSALTKKIFSIENKTNPAAKVVEQVVQQETQKVEQEIKTDATKQEEAPK